jgi:phosphatidate cytidylyltransferase
LNSQLKQRILTALVLLVILAFSLIATSPIPFMAVVIFFIGAAAWEWGKLNNFNLSIQIFFGSILAMLMTVIFMSELTLMSAPGWIIVLSPLILLWSFIALFFLGIGYRQWPKTPEIIKILMGLYLLFGCALSIFHVWQIGLNFLFSVFALVWAADICAYFGGKKFGRHRLAPDISPNKTWEGAFFGFLGVVGVALIWFFIDQQIGGDGIGLSNPSLFTMLYRKFGVLGAGLSIFALTGMSIVGDIFESLIKRHAGAKDSSQLLPGHGGVLDRIDALLPVFPLALLLIYL